MYTDKYLRFDTEAQAQSVLYTEVPTEWDEEGEPTAWERKPNYANIDVIGTIYTGGEWDAEGDVIVEPVALDGWHVNVRVVDEDADPLMPYSIVPTTPRRVWG